jgi:hypothetical protein
MLNTFADPSVNTKGKKLLISHHLLILPNITYTSWELAEYLVHISEYLMIYRGPGFLAVIRFGPSPTPYPPGPLKIVKCHRGLRVFRAPQNMFCIVSVPYFCKRKELINMERAKSSVGEELIKYFKGS